MLSIMRFDGDIDIESTIAEIESYTLARVTGYDIRGEWVFILLEHDNTSRCKICGDEIHSHGHGLCLMCWTVQKAKLGAKS